MLEKKNRKRDAILKAAGEIFSRFGYEKTSLDDIGRAVGLNKASLYYYFKNKDDLFLELVLQETRAFNAELEARTLAIPDVRRQVRFFLTERIRRYEQMIHLTSLSTEKVGELEPVYRDLDKELHKKTTDFLTALLKRGVAENHFSFPQQPSAVVAETLLHMLMAFEHDVVFMSRKNDQYSPLDFTRAIENLERLLALILR
ncbi:MAG: TetR/AcrR family transcriptional regulator [Saprospiraceae bacterium]|nr:TetR/AcrR family transcriptional regulator [Saprospiraceae bacterium]